jgi:hypothetical protein
LIPTDLHLSETCQEKINGETCSQVASGVCYLLGVAVFPFQLRL